jgi:hypothetical protein
MRVDRKQAFLQNELPAARAGPVGRIYNAFSAIKALPQGKALKKG